jgi:hypothetical protein
VFESRTFQLRKLFLFQAHEVGVIEPADGEGGRVHPLLRLSGLHRAQALPAQGLLQDLRLPAGDLSNVQSCYSDHRKVVERNKQVSQLSNVQSRYSDHRKVVDLNKQLSQLASRQLAFSTNYI